MATCKECLHFEVCSGFMPTDLDKDVWHYCKIGIPEEIPDIDKRCDSFSDVHQVRYRKKNQISDRLAEVADPVPAAERLLGEIKFF